MPLFSPHAEILVQWMGILPLGALCGHQARDDYPAMTLMGRGCDRQVPGVCAGRISRRCTWHQALAQVPAECDNASIDGRSRDGGYV